MTIEDLPAGLLPGLQTSPSAPAVRPEPSGLTSPRRARQPSDGRGCRDPAPTVDTGRARSADVFAVGPVDDLDTDARVVTAEHAVGVVGAGSAVEHVVAVSAFEGVVAGKPVEGHR
jgi:hypothetical protein